MDKHGEPGDATSSAYQEDLIAIMNQPDMVTDPYRRLGKIRIGEAPETATSTADKVFDRRGHRPEIQFGPRQLGPHKPCISCKSYVCEIGGVRCPKCCPCGRCSVCWGEKPVYVNLCTGEVRTAEGGRATEGGRVAEGVRAAEGGRVTEGVRAAEGNRADGDGTADEHTGKDSKYEMIEVD